MNELVYDLETNGLLRQTTKIHCGTIYDVKTNKSYMYCDEQGYGADGTIEDMVDILKNATTVIGHNIIKFDNMVIQKLYGVNLTKEVECIDTLIASKLIFPDMMKSDKRYRAMPSNLRGSHSLRAWGYRTKTMKDDYSGGWEQLNKEMYDYCRQDGVATNAIYTTLASLGLPEKALDLEQGFAHIISRQEMRGVKFNVKKAQKLHIELEEAKEEALRDLMKAFPPLPIWTPQTELKTKQRRDGTNSVAYQKQLDRGCIYREDTLEWGYYKMTEFKPTSAKHLVYWIEELYGKQKWQTTEKGSPKTGANEIKEMFGDKEWAKPLLHYMEVNKLLSQLATGKQAWLQLVEGDRIYGTVDTLGAVTRRCTHNRPNMAQVPSAGGFKGAECRALFEAPKGYKIVGCDASGLELRVLAHYMAKYDGGKYGKTILEGDIHTENQKAAGLPTRNNAKTFIYGFLYGAGAAKLGEIVGGGFKEGDKLKKRFLKKLPAIAQLSEAVVKAVKENGTLKALDGNPYMIRSEHSALNVLLQGAGALVMKYWLIEYDKVLQENFKVGEDYEFVLNIHDEAQVECKAEIADKVAKIAEEAFATITRQLNFRIKLEGEAKIGDNWYETH